MTRINTSKVVVGGLVAGLIFNLGDFILNSVVMAEDYRQTMTRLGLDVAAMETPAGILPWIVIDFLYGLLVIWTYAAIRPRFGPGPKTAIMAGLVPFAAATLLFAGFTSMGMFSTELLVKGTVFGLPHYVIGSLAGAWMYTES